MFKYALCVTFFLLCGNELSVVFGQEPQNVKETLSETELYQKIDECKQKIFEMKKYVPVRQFVSDRLRQIPDVSCESLCEEALFGVFYSGAIYPHLGDTSQRIVRSFHKSEKYPQKRKEILELWCICSSVINKGLIKDFAPYSEMLKGTGTHSELTADVEAREVQSDDVLVKRTELNIHRLQASRQARFYESSNSEIFFLYSHGEPAYIELLAVLKQHDYPKAEILKICSALNILPYEGFREWQSIDGLFKATAKFVSLTESEVTLEKADGKQTTIELSALRQEDQDYVKRQSQPQDAM